MNLALPNLLIWPLVAAIYFPVFFQLYTVRWELIDYTHAYFILPICIALVWYKRKDLLQVMDVNSNNAAYLALLSLGAALFTFGSRLDYVFISTLSLIPLVTGIAGYLYGKKALSVLKFPLIYLFFLVPPPVGILDGITTPLRHGTSSAVVIFLRSFDIPIRKEGLLLYLNNHEIYMAPACSGFRSLITFMALAVLFVHLTAQDPRKRNILLASVIPLALLGNFIRVAILCLITYYFGEDLGQGFLHTFSGFIVFLIILMGFMTIDRIMNAKHED
jgi:exosortase